MKELFMWAGFYLLPAIMEAQQLPTDSLWAVVQKHKADTNEVKARLQLAYRHMPGDSARAMVETSLALAKKIDFAKGEADSYLMNAILLYTIDITESILQAIKALNIYNKIDDKMGIVAAHGILQGTYREIGDYDNALFHAFQTVNYAKANHIQKQVFYLDSQSVSAALFAEIAQTYLLLNKLDSAKLYAEKSINEKEMYNGSAWNFPVYLSATIENMLGHYQTALRGYRRAVHLAKQNRIFRDTLQIFSGMATTFRNLKQLDSSIYYGSVVFHSANPEREIKTLLEALYNLAEGYKLSGKKDSAIKYLELNHAFRDSLLGRDKERKIQNVVFNERLREQALVAAQANYKNRVQMVAFASGGVVLLLILIILWKSKQKELRAKHKVESAYANLKAAQQQLIQSEKMASLGELTAGIAHEIQNPLNFVNNFSEINTELIEEMKQAMTNREVETAGLLMANIKENEEKISFHGQRASSIVKSMLQHSRISTGKKEPTDINALIDEYLRLSYHGLRAKEKTFHANCETSFDKSIGKIEVVPQDLGRVFLNLFNNAFYSVTEKKKLTTDTYRPTVEVETKKGNGHIEIRVRDNGMGIPENLLEKVFQPFFTTKPAGAGTGLGLSLSYDIITKQHQGEMKVETKMGSFAEFMVLLPVSPNRENSG